MKGAWLRAAKLAEQTPAARNRCVDFLRAASIFVVVLGHWLMAAPWVDEEGSHISHLLAISPWSQWLTWVLQVMPVFFFVGGYANGISWDAAMRDGKSYGEWLGSRLRRLLSPVLVLLFFWVLTAAAAHRSGVPEEMIRIASQVALVPTWFLAVYAVVVFFVPWTRAAWKKLGIFSFWIPALAAALVDAGFFKLGWKHPGWANYLFVWGAVHQLGYAWLDGRFASRIRSAIWCLAGLGALIAMTELGPWPRSLVGVPGDDVSNTTPPHLPILALAAFQFGGVMLIEGLLARLLAGLRMWTATVLINGMIMTVFLWHSTVMMLLYGLGILLGGVGLKPLPGTGAWWGLHCVWIAAFLVGLLPFVLAFGRFERPRPAKNAAAWRTILGCMLMAFGLAMLAKGGIAGSDPLGLRALPVILPFVGAEVAGFGPLMSLLRKKEDDG